MKKKSSHWYPRYVGDYMKKTQHLSMLEHGAYTLLMDYYYSQNQPLAANASVLQRVCRAFASAEQDAVQSVLTQFFTLRDGFYHNERADEEILKRGKISEIRSKSALKRYDANAPANAVQMHLQMQTQPQPHPYKRKEEEKKQTNKQKKESLAAQEPPGFAEFWVKYPKTNCSRKESLSSYIKALTKGIAHETIMRGLDEYRKFLNATGTPAAHGTTWLNNERWSVDYVAATAERNRIRQGSGAGGAYAPKSTWRSEGERLAAKYLGESDAVDKSGQG